MTKKDSDHPASKLADLEQGDGLQKFQGSQRL